MSETLTAALISGAVAAVISAITNIVLTMIHNKKQLAKMAPQLPAATAEGETRTLAAGVQRIDVLRDILVGYIGFATNKEEEALLRAIKELDDYDKMESVMRIALKSNSFKAFMSGAKKELNY